MLSRYSTRLLLSKRITSSIVAATRTAAIPTASYARLQFMSTASIEQQPAVDSVPVRNTVKPIDSRKTTLIDIYSHTLKTSPVILILHHNNLLSAEDQQLRAQIKKAGGELQVIRPRLFKVALRGQHHEDPASKDAAKLFRNKKSDVFPLLSGPTAIVSFKELDPKAVAGVVRIVDKSSGSLTLMGAIIDEKVQSIADVAVFKTLPTLAEVRSQLVGVLTVVGGAGLVQTLEASSKVLYLTMEERRKQLDPAEQAKNEDENGSSEEKKE